MKIALVEIAPELAAEAFAVLREAGALVLGSLDAQPHLRVVISHADLPVECGPGRGASYRRDLPPHPVLMHVKADEAGKLRLAGFQINPYVATAAKPRRAR